MQLRRTIEILLSKKPGALRPHAPDGKRTGLQELGPITEYFLFQACSRTHVSVSDPK